MTTINTVIVLLDQPVPCWWDQDRDGPTRSLWCATQYSANEAAILVTRLNLRYPREHGKFCATEPIATAAQILVMPHDPIV